MVEVIMPPTMGAAMDSLHLSWQHQQFFLISNSGRYSGPNWICEKITAISCDFAFWMRMASTCSSDRWQCWPAVFKAEFANTVAGLQLDLGTLATADRTSNTVCCALLIRVSGTSNALPRSHAAQNETNNLSLFQKPYTIRAYGIDFQWRLAWYSRSTNSVDIRRFFCD